MQNKKSFAILREHGPIGDLHIHEILPGQSDQDINWIMHSRTWTRIDASDKETAIAAFQRWEAEQSVQRVKSGRDRHFIAAL